MDLARGPNGKTEQTFRCLYCRDTGVICFAEDIEGNLVKLPRPLACDCNKQMRSLAEYGGVFLENNYRRIDQGDAVGRWLDQRWEEHLIDNPDAEKLPCFDPTVFVREYDDAPF